MSYRDKRFLDGDRSDVVTMLEDFDGGRVPRLQEARDDGDGAFQAVRLGSGPVDPEYLVDALTRGEKFWPHDHQKFAESILNQKDCARALAKAMREVPGKNAYTLNMYIELLFNDRRARKAAEEAGIRVYDSDSDYHNDISCTGGVNFTWPEFAGQGGDEDEWLELSYTWDIILSLNVTNGTRMTLAVTNIEKDWDEDDVDPSVTPGDFYRPTFQNITSKSLWITDIQDLFAGYAAQVRSIEAELKAASRKAARG